MCGIFGIINYTSEDNVKFQDHLDLIQHRGPDDSGIYKTKDVLLGHRRLSIIDLDTGHQPISTEDSRFHIIYNGECYNFHEIKTDLEGKGYNFKTKTDTEVVLKGFQEFGTGIFEKINGMFALAIWDEKKKILYLARDRFGQKPLYYAMIKNKLIFSSELNPIVKAFPKLNKLNYTGLTMFLTMQSVPDPLTIFKDVKKLSPGSFLKFENNKITIAEYSILNFNNKVKFDSTEELVSRFWSEIESAVKYRLVSDVPLGVFLSGGVDSAVIVTALHRLGMEGIKTFSIGFKDQPDNEIKWAKQVADKFKTEHTELILDPVSISVIEELITNFGEPFGDTSVIPTYYISKAVSSSIKVVLGGDGGDEMMGGYDTYSQMIKARKINTFLIPFLPGLFCLNFLKINESINHRLRQLYIAAHREKKIYPLSRTFYYSKMSKEILNINFKSLINIEPFDLYLNIFNSPNAADLIDQVFLADIKLPLANTLLPKIDITAMANSIEVRAPFLDKSFAQFAFSLDSKMKLKNNVQKHIPKKALEKYFNNEFIYRKKQGFNAPIKTWLRNENRNYLLQVLSKTELNKHGIFKVHKVEKLIKEFISGRFDHSPFLWILLNFQIWFNHYKPEL